MNRRSRPLTAAVIAAQLASASAAGARPEQATLTLPDCAEQPELLSALRTALAVELRAQNVTLYDAAALPPDAGALNIVLVAPCEWSLESVEVRVTLHDAQRSRRVGLSDLPHASRARALALSVAELVTLVIEPGAEGAASGAVGDLAEATSPPEAAQGEAGTTPPSPPTSATGAKPRAPNARPRPAAKPPISDDAPAAASARSASGAGSSTRVALAPEARWFDGGSSLWGARAQLATQRLVFGASILGGGATVPAGDVSALLLHALAGYRALEWQHARRWSFAAGPRLALGVIRVEGQPEPGVEGGHIVETYVDAALFGSAEMRLGTALRLGASVEAGYAHGVIGLSNGEPIAHYGGGLAGALLSLGLEL